jgi:hypothetical protein
MLRSNCPECSTVVVVTECSVVFTFSLHVHCVLVMNYEPASSITILRLSWVGQKAQPVLYIQIERPLPQPLTCCEAPCAKDYFPNHGSVDTDRCSFLVAIFHILVK